MQSPAGHRRIARSEACFGNALIETGLRFDPIIETRLTAAKNKIACCAVTVEQWLSSLQNVGRAVAEIDFVAAAAFGSFRRKRNAPRFEIDLLPPQATDFFPP